MEQSVELTAEQEARDMLERCGWEEAQDASASDVVEVANLMSERHAHQQAMQGLQGQIDQLAKFIMANVPGEPSQSQGAVETAIRIIDRLQAEVERLEEIEADYSVDYAKLERQLADQRATMQGLVEALKAQATNVKMEFSAGATIKRQRFIPALSQPTPLSLQQKIK
jgi:hypothetical protein